MPGQSIDDIYVEVRLMQNQLRRDFQKIQSDSEKSAKGIEDAYKKAKPQFNNTLLKKNLSEIIILRDKLKAKLEQKISLNADLKSIERTRTQLNKVESALKGVETQSEKGGNQLKGMFDGGLQRITAFAAKVGATLLVVKKLFDFSKEADSIKVLRSTFEALATKEGLDAKVLFEQMQAATHGAVTEINLLKTANRGKFLGIDMKALPTLLEFATLRAKQTGEEIDYLVNSIIVGLGRKSPLILDNLGLSINQLNEAVKEAAKRHGVFISVVNEENRALYLTEAAAIIAKRSIKEFSGEVNNLNTRSDQFTTSWNKFTNALGETFIPIFTAVLTVLTDVDEVAVSLDANLSKIINRIFSLNLSKKNPFSDYFSNLFKDIEAPTGLRENPTTGVVPPANQRLVPNAEGGLTLFTFKENAKDSVKTIGELKKEIESLVKDQDSLLPGSKDLAENIKEVERLTKLVTDATTVEKKETESLVDKIKTEVELKELTKSLTDDILNSAMETLNSQLTLLEKEKESTDNQKKKIDLIKAINELTEKQKKLTEETNLSNLLETSEKLLPKPLDIQPKEYDPKANDEDLKAREEIERKLHELRIANIDSEFERREALIKAEYEEEVEQLDKKNMTNEEYQEALDLLERKKENDLAEVVSERFRTALNSARSISSALSTIVGSGNEFVDRLSQALEIAEAIAAIISSINIISSLFSATPVQAVTEVNSPKVAKKTGGEVLRGQNIKSYNQMPHLATGGEVVGGRKIASYNQIPKFAIGGEFNVPSRYTNDSFLMRVSADERVKVTPANQVGNTDKLLSVIADRISALNQNVNNLETKVDIVNNAPDVNTIVRRNKKVENNLIRQGIKFNES